MADAEEVVALVDRGDTELSGLVLNERGWDRFSNLDRVNCTLAATETFNQRNGNATLDEAVARVQTILARADVPTTVTVSCAFGDPFEGEVDPAAVADVCERVRDAGEVVLADTIGVATPRRVRELVERVSILGPPVGVHLHNTRNTGYASAWAAIDAGASVLDASVGGLGGCPFSPNATGNVATEDLVWQLERDGVRTGIDLDALVETARWLEGVLGRELPGYVHRAARWP
jgi:hydroxymethylglutaryl-CoA lyase/(R)-citramalyl-CoA lyase